MAQLAWIAMTRADDGRGPATDAREASLERRARARRQANGLGRAQHARGARLQRGEGERAHRADEEASRCAAGSATGGCRELAAEPGARAAARRATAGVRRLLFEGGSRPRARDRRHLERIGRARGPRPSRASAGGAGGGGGLLPRGARAGRRRGATSVPSPTACRGWPASATSRGRRARRRACWVRPTALLDEIGATRTPGEHALDADLRPRLRSALGEDFDHEVETGRGLALAEAVAFALGSAAR